MTSEEIKKWQDAVASEGLQTSIALAEIAFQLAVMNERAKRMDDLEAKMNDLERRIV